MAAKGSFDFVRRVRHRPLSTFHLPSPSLLLLLFFFDLTLLSPSLTFISQLQKTTSQCCRITAAPRHFLLTQGRSQAASRSAETRAADNSLNISLAGAPFLSSPVGKQSARKQEETEVRKGRGWTKVTTVDPICGLMNNSCINSHRDALAERCRAAGARQGVHCAPPACRQLFLHNWTDRESQRKPPPSSSNLKYPRTVLRINQILYV